MKLRAIHSIAAAVLGFGMTCGASALAYDSDCRNQCFEEWAYCMENTARTGCLAARIACNNACALDDGGGEGPGDPDPGCFGPVCPAD